MSYYSNAPREHTPSHIKTGIGTASIFRSADCIQQAVRGEEHPPVNTSHCTRGKALQSTHPYAYAALRRAESAKLQGEIALTMERSQAKLPTSGR